jgi:formamidopyrimidine-DNA glycosylase
MPELPEVEGARRGLVSHVVGKRLMRLEVLDPKLWLPAEGLDADSVRGRVVEALERRAKLMLFVLDGGLALVLHLKVAGQLVYEPPDGRRVIGGHPYPLPDVALPESSTRFVFDFDDGGRLFVNDQRRFAWLRLVTHAGAAELIAAQQYGPDPLDPTFTPEVLAGRLKLRKGRPIKAALLDQTCIAGLGNIYADEVLHAARLHPMERTGDLGESEIGRLHRAIVDVLSVAVPVGGAIVANGRAVLDSASGRDFLRVHGRAGEPCPDCTSRTPPNDPSAAVASDGQAGEPAAGRGGDGYVIRAFLAGRGTYFCPTCQPAPPGFVLPQPAPTPRGANSTASRSS